MGLAFKYDKNEFPLLKKQTLEWKPFKQPFGGESSFVRQASPYIAPFVLPGIGTAIAGATGLGLTASTALANAGFAAATGGDPLRAAMGAAIMGGTNPDGSYNPGVLGNLPGDMGKFFNTKAGGAIKQAMAASLGAGDVGKFSGFLEMLGITGKQKDVVEDILALTALTALSERFAKDAIDKANRYEAKEEGLINSLVEQAEKLSSPKMMEQTVQKALEQVGTEFERARSAETRSLYQRGLGERTAGAEAALRGDEAIERLRARRDIGLEYPLRAMQASAAALNPLQAATQRAKEEAEAQRRLPMEFYQAYKGATARSPEADYYDRLMRQMDLEDQAAAAAAGYDPLSGLGLYGPIVKDFKSGWGTMAQQYNKSQPATTYNYSQTRPELLAAQQAAQAAAQPQYGAQVRSWSNPFELLGGIRVR